MEVLLIHSYKGGSGKTIFSVNLARSLAVTHGKRVLLIEADFTGAAFQSIFTANSPRIFFNDFFNDTVGTLGEYIYHEENIDVIYSSNKYRSTDGIHKGDQSWFLKKKHQLAIALENLDYDYVIFDSAPGFSLFVVNVLALADMVFLISRTDKQSQDGLSSVIDNLYKKSRNLSKQSSFTLSVVLNQIPSVPEIERVIDGLSFYLQRTYPFIADIYRVPYEHTTSYYTTIERFILPQENPTLEKVETIASKIIGT